MNSTIHPTADAYFAERFSYGTPRSAEYKAGFLAQLRKLYGEQPKLGPCPYPPGSVQFDAWCSGAEAANISWSVYQDRLQGGAK